MNYRLALYTPSLVLLLLWSGTAPEAERAEFDDFQQQYADFAFVKIPAGPFTFGCFDERQRIDYDYWIMKYEVTTAQYVAFLNLALDEGKIWLKDGLVFTHYAGDSLKPAGDYYLTALSERLAFTDGRFVGNDRYSDHPMIGVGWFGCQAFCEHYGFRLPTAREWEKAARGNTGWDYPWGDEIDGSRANYYGSGGPFEGGTSPVGFYDGRHHDGFQTRDSPSPYGLYDMSGNAWEYTSDLWSESLPFHIGAGGGFAYHTAAMVNTWYRSCYGLPFPLNLDRYDQADGFRAVKDFRQ